MGRTKDLLSDCLEEEIADDVKPKIKPYSENAALKRAQQRYYEKNKEEKLKHNKEYLQTWISTKDIEELRAKRRESCKRYYNKMKLLKESKQEQEPRTSEDDKIAMYMDLFDEIFDTNPRNRIEIVNGRLTFPQSSE